MIASKPRAIPMRGIKNKAIKLDNDNGSTFPEVVNSLRKMNALSTTLSVSGGTFG